MNRADQIYNNVLKAMQEAEEIEGVEGVDYLNLMGKIIDEASTRLSVHALDMTRPLIKNGD